MGYINFDDPKWEKSRSVIDFCRYVNNRFIFKSAKWEEYKTTYKTNQTNGQMSMFD